MKILNFGSLSLDRFYSVDGFTRPGVAVSAAKYELWPGGRGFRQSIALARAGSEVYHAGKIGPDGKPVLDALRENGVNTGYILTDGSCTGHNIVQINRYSNRCVLSYSGANREITKEDIDWVLAGFSAGDLLVMQNEISCLPYLIHAASEKQMILAMNLSPVNDSPQCSALHRINYLIINEEEGRSLTGEIRPSRTLDALMARYPRLKVALTLGKNGSFYADELQRLRQTAFPAEKKECAAFPAMHISAAGDTFLGFFLSRLFMGCTPWHSLRAASLAAALAVGKKGSHCSIPRWDDVLCFWSSR